MKRGFMWWFGISTPPTQSRASLWLSRGRQRPARPSARTERNSSSVTRTVQRSSGTCRRSDNQSSPPILFPLRAEGLLQAFQIRIRFHLHHPDVFATGVALAHNAFQHAVLALANRFEECTGQFAGVNHARNRQRSEEHTSEL